MLHLLTFPGTHFRSFVFIGVHLESAVWPAPLIDAVTEGIRRIEDLAMGRALGLTEEQFRAALGLLSSTTRSLSRTSGGLKRSISRLEICATRSWERLSAKNHAQSLELRFRQ
jgi:hypothetical protein